MVTLDRAWCVLCALKARKPAHGHGHGHGQKAGENEFWRKLRHKRDCCCFEWAVYAPWACYMNLRALYVPKLAKCPLTCPADLAGDLSNVTIGHSTLSMSITAGHSYVLCQGFYVSFMRIKY